MGATVYEAASGDINVWVNEGGALSLKVREPFGDPIELNEQDAIELSDLLRKLVREIS